MVRRSRGLLLFASILILHIIILSVIRYDPSPKRSFFYTNIVDLKEALVNRIQPNNPISTINQLIYAKFNEIYLSEIVEDEQDKLFLLNLDRNDEFDEIHVERPSDKWFFASKQDDPKLPQDDQTDTQTPSPTTTQSALIKPYDPRFTFSLLLHNITQQLAADPLSTPTLPYFHWADYVDTSVLENYYSDSSKKACDFFDVTTSSPNRNVMNELVDTDRYCFDDNQIDEMISSSSDSQFIHNLELIKKSPASTGFHIFSFGGRSTLSTREIIAKSYLKEFMPPPLSLNILLPNNQNMYIKVEQDIIKSKNRLHTTELMKSFFSSHKNINTRNSLQEFQKVLTKASVPLNLSYYKHLKHEQFVDNSVKYFQQMTNQQLDPIEENYYNSLKYSLTAPDAPKYFNEAKLIKKEFNYAIGAHYDWRFYGGIINYTDRQAPALYGLFRAWLKLANSNNLTTWIAHGSLLSWYWNGISFPWDNDIDVQMPIEHLHKLARKFNQSMIIDFGDDLNKEIRYGRYFLDCGTFISQRERGNGNNNIDARFIDLETGFYVDITGLAVSDTISPIRYNNLLTEPFTRENEMSEFDRNGFLQVYNCRNYHFSTLSELSPLKLSMVEGEFTYVPNKFQQILGVEYDENGTKSLNFNGFTFLPRLRNWIQSLPLSDYLHSHETTVNKNAPISTLVTEFDNDQYYIDFVFSDKNILMEYLLTKDITEFHDQEMKMLLQSGNASDLFFDELNKLKVKLTILRHDYFTYNAFKSKYEFTLKLNKDEDKIEMSNSPPSVEEIIEFTNLRSAAKVTG